MTSLSVIIPSRVQENQAIFLRRSIGSVAAQTARSRVDIEVVVGLDPGAPSPDLGIFDIPVRFVHGTECVGAVAVNAAAAAATGDYLAILEDDDVWDPKHLEISLQALERCGFVSGNELEVDPEGTVVRINDFPTPSGWVMPRSTWELLGPLDTSFRVHQDNEWLGRLATYQVPRVHLIEATAPVVDHVARQVRPWLANILDFGGGQVRFMRHRSPLPLIRRLVHPDSIMARIAAGQEIHSASDVETERLVERYGRIPW